MSTINIEAAFDRIREVTGKKTQVEIAEYFGIRQSSISDAKRRNAIPDSWLVTLVEEEGINPIWIKTGNGPMHLKECITVTAPELSTEMLFHEVRRRFSNVTITL